MIFSIASKRVRIRGRRPSRAIMLLIMVLSPSLLSVTQVYSSQVPAELREWTVPTPRSGIWGLTLDPSGNCCWFLEYSGNKVGNLDPSTGTFREWEIPTEGANPYSIAITTISGSSVLWGTEFGADRVFQFSPDSGLFREYTLGLYLNSGVAYVSAEPPGAQVRVWFTESTKNRNGEFIYDQNTGNVTLYEDAFPVAVGGGAYGVYAGSSYVWFVGFSALVRWDRASQKYTIWPLPVHGSSVGRLITLDQYGQPWYTQGVTDGTSSDNFVGVLRGNSTIQEWRIPSFGSDPRGISINPLTQQPWIAERSPTAGTGTIATLDAFGGVVVSSVPTTAPSGGTPTIIAPIVSQVDVSTHTVTPTTNPILSSQKGQFTEYALGSTLPHDAIVDSSGNIWISEPGTNMIARLSLRGSDFALSASPPVISLSQGSSGIVAISGASVSGYTGRVTLAIPAIPRGVTVSSFNPNQLNISPREGTVSSKLTINIATNASAGTNAVLIQGTDGTIAHVISLMLMITNTTTPSTSSGARCLIATATYGSELSPEVQLLRNFRDNSVEKTKAGSSFLTVFNAWYYSFSPYVASYLADHEIAQTAMRFALYPLIAFLFLTARFYTGLSAYPELAILLSGLLASSLIGAFYIGLPFGLLNRRLRLTRNFRAKIPGMLLLAGIGAILIGQVLSSTLLLMVSSSITVLATMYASATLTAALISRSSKSVSGTNKMETEAPK